VLFFAGVKIKLNFPKYRLTIFKTKRKKERKRKKSVNQLQKTIFFNKPQIKNHFWNKK